MGVKKHSLKLEERPTLGRLVAGVWSQELIPPCVKWWWWNTYFTGHCGESATDFLPFLRFCYSSLFYFQNTSINDFSCQVALRTSRSSPWRFVSGASQNSRVHINSAREAIFLGRHLLAFDSSLPSLQCFLDAVLRWQAPSLSFYQEFCFLATPIPQAIKDRTKFPLGNRWLLIIWKMWPIFPVVIELEINSEPLKCCHWDPSEKSFNCWAHFSFMGLLFWGLFWKVLQNFNISGPTVLYYSDLRMKPF